MPLRMWPGVRRAGRPNGRARALTPGPRRREAPRLILRTAKFGNAARCLAVLFPAVLCLAQGVSAASANVWRVAPVPYQHFEAPGLARPARVLARFTSRRANAERQFGAPSAGAG
jgi:hypothetical protein